MKNISLDELKMISKAQQNAGAFFGAFCICRAINMQI
jgi:hypothetical protein